MINMFYDKNLFNFEIVHLYSMHYIVCMTSHLQYKKNLSIPRIKSKLRGINLQTMGVADDEFDMIRIKMNQGESESAYFIVRA